MLHFDFSLRNQELQQHARRGKLRIAGLDQMKIALPIQQIRPIVLFLRSDAVGVLGGDQICSAVRHTVKPADQPGRGIWVKLNASMIDHKQMIAVLFQRFQFAAYAVFII